MDRIDNSVDDSFENIIKSMQLIANNIRQQQNYINQMTPQTLVEQFYQLNNYINQNGFPAGLESLYERFKRAMPDVDGINDYFKNRSDDELATYLACLNDRQKILLYYAIEKKMEFSEVTPEMSRLRGAVYETLPNSEQEWLMNRDASTDQLNAEQNQRDRSSSNPPYQPDVRIRIENNKVYSKQGNYKADINAIVKASFVSCGHYELVNGKYTPPAIADRPIDEIIDHAMQHPDGKTAEALKLINILDDNGKLTAIGQNAYQAGKKLKEAHSFSLSGLNAPAENHVEDNPAASEEKPSQVTELAANREIFEIIHAGNHFFEPAKPSEREKAFPNITNLLEALKNNKPFKDIQKIAKEGQAMNKQLFSAHKNPASKARQEMFVCIADAQSPQEALEKLRELDNKLKSQQINLSSPSTLQTPPLSRHSQTSAPSKK